MSEDPNGSLAGRIQRQVEHEGFRLPVFNPVAVKLMQVLEDAPDMAQVERLILKDAGLAAELMRVANSPLFSGLNQTPDLHTALVRLGTKQVVSIAMLAAQEQAFKAQHPLLANMMKHLWLHSMCSAVAARWVAERCGLRAERETAFMAGLLHDVGSLAIVRILDDLLAKGEAPVPTESLLEDLVSSLHTNFGYQVLVAWELPTVYADVARDHDDSLSRSAPPLQAIIRLVDAACALLGVGQPPATGYELEDLEETTRLGLKPVHLAELELLIEDAAHKAGCTSVGRAPGG